MPPEGNSDPLQRMQQRLYANNAPSAAPDESFRPRTPAPQPQTQPPAKWKPEAPKPPRAPINWTLWFLIGAAAFCAIAVVVTLLFLSLGGRSVSNNNLDLKIQGPTTIASGTTVPIVVTIQNRNPENITNAKVSIVFPDGTRSADNVTQPLPPYVGDLGTVVAGGTATRTIQAVLFGSVNQAITIPITITYGAQDSNATFTKTENYTFTVTSSPLTVTAQSVAEVSSGQTFTIAIAVHSNATTPLQNVAVTATYPSGFSPTVSGIATTSGSTYVIGTLNPGEEKDFTLTGSLTGTDNAEQDLQFMTGTLKDDGSNSLDVAYASADTKISIQQPFLKTALTLNNQSADPVVISAGQEVAGTVSWANTLSSAIPNAEVDVKLSGGALVPSSVQVANGYYNSSTNTIIFNGQTEQSLSNLNPGDSGNGSFSFTTKSADALAGSGSSGVTLNVSVSGRVNGSTQTLTNTVTKHVQIASSIGLSSKLFHGTGPFANTGPMPPAAGTPTTYTVQLSIANTVNAVAGAVVAAILPPYVTYTGQAVPADGSVTYDSSSHTVTWKAGAISAGAGTSSGSADTADFQISFTPSSSQAGQAPVLVESQELTGTDRVTGTSVDSTAAALTTQNVSDPGFTPAVGNVAN